MAGRDSPPLVCQGIEGLLLKLKQGQDVLRKSISELKPPAEVIAATRNVLEQQKQERACRDSLTIKLDKVADFPRKRARLQQLTPDYEVGMIWSNSRKITTYLVTSDLWYS